MDLLLNASNSESSSQLSIGKATSFAHNSYSDCLSINEDYTDESDDSTNSPPSRRSIAVAKQILSEATNSFTPKLSISAAKHDMCKNTGALGPLLEMLRVSGDVEKVRLCLETVSFLSLDKANRKTIAGLDGVGALLEVMERLDDAAVKIAALQALVTLVRHEDATKVKLWSHPNKRAALKLLNSKQSSTSQQLDAIACVRKIAFSADKSLLEPQALSHIADLLHPSASHMVLMKVVRFLRIASKTALIEHMSAWHSAVFKLAPLISPPKPEAPQCSAGSGRVSSSGGASTTTSMSPQTLVCEEALAVLLNLCEHAPFRNVVYASGCIPSLLVLPSSETKIVRITAVCILSHLCESSLTSEQLCSESSLIALLRLLQSSTCMNVTIGLCYVLCRLVVFKPSMKDLLRQCRTVSMLKKLQSKLKDEDVVMGILQLLELLEVAPQSLSRRSGSVAPDVVSPGNGKLSPTVSPTDSKLYQPSTAVV